MDSFNVSLAWLLLGRTVAPVRESAASFALSVYCSFLPFLRAMHIAFLFFLLLGDVYLAPRAREEKREERDREKIFGFPGAQKFSLLCPPFAQINSRTMKRGPKSTNPWGQQKREV